VSARNETIQKLREELEEIKTGTVTTLRLPEHAHPTPEHLTLTLRRPLTHAPFTCPRSPARPQVNEIKALEADTKAQEEADKTGFQSKEAALKEELAKLSAELAKRKDEDRESEEILRKRKVKYELEVENWISRCGPPAQAAKGRRRRRRRWWWWWWW
jgi:hypothetical protein